MSGTHAHEPAAAETGTRPCGCRCFPFVTAGVNLTERGRRGPSANRGKTNKEIVRDLYIRETTVKYHVTNLIVKLRVRRRAELAYSAIQHGLIRES